MKEIQISQAQPLGDQKPQDVTIKIDQSKVINSDGNNIEAIENNFKFEAKMLHDALLNSIPQGTRHRLLILLLTDAVNLLGI